MFGSVTPVSAPVHAASSAPLKISIALSIDTTSARRIQRREQQRLLTEVLFHDFTAILHSFREYQSSTLQSIDWVPKLLAAYCLRVSVSVTTIQNYWVPPFVYSSD